MKKLYILSLLFCLTSVYSQSKLKKANNFFETLAYIDTAKAYGEYLEKEDKPSIKTIQNAADSYYYINDDRNALKWYEKLYQMQGESISDLYFFRYIQTLKGVTDYDKADKLTKEFLTRKGDQKEIARYMHYKNQLDSLSKAKPLYDLKNLAINTSKADFGATFYGDKIVYASSRDTTNFKDKLYSWNKQPFLNLYVSERNASDGSLSEPTVFLPNAKTKYHEALVAFSSDWQTVYYTTNIVKGKSNKLVTDDTRTNNFQIVKGTIENGELKFKEKVFFSDKSYSVGHPALSEDGKWLFFASDMPGGYGRTDLYVIQIADDGTMGSPQNLGPTINTTADESFPFFRNGKLYFSSEGHYGLGDLDVYESTFLGSLQFSKPVNLGKPINSNKDDFAYIVDATDKYGYVSSNRAQGKGDDDIYYFTKEKPVCNQIVSGKVINTKSKVAIAQATIKVYDQFGDVVTETTTDNAGLYTVTVPCDKRLKLIASKVNHSNDEKEVVTNTSNGVETKNIDFELSNYDDLIVRENNQDKIIVNPIYFDYNKWDITPRAEAELDRVVFAMQKFPNIKIKIEAHTDSRGKDAYNEKLSDNRAKATQTYIISKGIDASRIESAIGYGESRLTNKCRNGVKCSEEEHNKNRRSEFIVIEK